jgi:hypothetical protein
VQVFVSSVLWRANAANNRAQKSRRDFCGPS